MDNDLALLHEKIDYLTTQVDAQKQRLEAIETQTNGRLYEKIDALSQHFEAQQQRQEEWNELKGDVIPIANHMIKLSIDELAEIGTEFQSEDLLFLVKRLLRDTPLLVGLLERLESTVDLVDETQLIGQQVFNEAVVTLDRLERDGYFAFARGGWQIIEKVVSEFSEDDIQALGDNVVTILKTVRSLTQPEIMTLTNNALSAIQEQPSVEDDVSMWSLMRDLSDPKTRRGLARLLSIVQVLADQPDQQGQQQN
jgi:uncharacterized protein YjgD (DUF1641 family)